MEWQKIQSLPLFRGTKVYGIRATHLNALEIMRGSFPGSMYCVLKPETKQNEIIATVETNRSAIYTRLFRCVALIRIVVSVVSVALILGFSASRFPDL